AWHCLMNDEHFAVAQPRQIPEVEPPSPIEASGMSAVRSADKSHVAASSGGGGAPSSASAPASAGAADRSVSPQAGSTAPTTRPSAPRVTLATTNGWRRARMFFSLVSDGGP